VSLMKPKLVSPGWAPEVKAWLEQLLLRGSGKRLPVVFDFDNTLVCGDIGEATLAQLVRNRSLLPQNVPASLAPSFTSATGATCDLSSAVDLTDYYEQLLAPTAHGSKDPAPFANGYIWAVEVMQGLKLGDVIQATAQVLEESRPYQIRMLDVTPGRTAYQVPFFYAEMLELIFELLLHEFDVWIVSASNVWSVRLMIKQGLNPWLRDRGSKTLIAPDHVVGVSTLLVGPNGQLFKDAVLVRENDAYAALDESGWLTYRLTPWLQYPVPTYSGKVGVIWDQTGSRPYLCAGDSPGDHAMLTFGENRLWLARLDKPDYLRATQLLITNNAASWALQPVMCRPAPGFISDASQVDQKISAAASKIRQAINLLTTNQPYGLR
jgi:hypothetical protein